MVDRATRKEILGALGTVPSFIDRAPPGTGENFWATMRDLQLAETEIPGKYKELIGLAVSAATRCKYCTFFHTEAAKLHGANQAEIAEANAMAAWTMAASTFLNGAQVDDAQFRKETLAILDHVRGHASA
ncbi:MAG: carboxymuconolactone decarboxylase family protein [Candidatus Thermoplasmatota archaeon]|nr:carboxymuconolactone decarboxylase family protein [Candidatus Thermoplasmatota archaeon]